MADNVSYQQSTDITSCDLLSICLDESTDLTGGRSRAHLVNHSRSHMTYNLGVVTESDHEIFLARKTCVFLSESQEEVRALVQQLFIANRV